MVLRLTMLTVALGGGFSPLYAAPSPEPDQTSEVIEVIGQTGYQSLNYQRLERDEFINSGQTLADLLKSINGIQIRQISGIGNPVSVSIRGSSSKQVQLYIDGQLMNDGQFGGFDLNQLPIEQIQSIEISKHQALGSGSTPIGGVIRVNTYNPQKNNTRLSVGLGSFGLAKLNLIHDQIFEHHQLSIGGAKITTDNDFDFLVPQDFNDPSSSTVQPLGNNQFEKSSLFINNEAQWGQHQVRLNLQYAKQQKAQPDYQSNSPHIRSYLKSDTLRYGYQHNWQSGLDWMEQLEFEYYRQHKDEQYNNQPGSGNDSLGDYDSDQQNLLIKPYITLSDWAISPFIEYSRQQFESFTRINGQAINCSAIGPCDTYAEQRQLNIGSRVQWQPKHWPISSYLLVSRLHEQNYSRDLNDSGGTSENASDSTEDHHSQEAGLSYSHPAFELSIHYADGIRPPTLFERFGDRGSFKGNDQLLAERAQTLSIGGSIERSNYSVSSSLYHQQQTNAIVAIFSSTGVGSYANVSDAKLTGLELQGRYQVNPQLSLLLQTNIIDSHSHSDIIAFNDKKVPGMYHQQYSIAAQYQFNQQLSFKFKTAVERELYFNRANRFNGNSGNGNPADRTSSDVYFHWQQPSIHVSIGINNLFNQNYQDLANRPAQGRSIQLTFSIEDL